MPRSLLCLFLLLIFASGCAVSPTATPSVTVTSEHQPRIETATLPATQAVLSQRSATPTRTVTPRPSITPTPTITVNTTTTAIVKELVKTIEPNRRSYPSPDGRWQVDLLTYGCATVAGDEREESAYVLMQIVSLADGQSSTFADSLLNCGGIGAGWPVGIIWEPNNRYFYYTNEGSGVSEDGSNWEWYRSVSRFDTMLNQVEWIGGPISPDKKKIVGIQWLNDAWCVPESVYVQTLDGEELVRYPVSGEEGNCPYITFTWAADSTKLVYLEAPCYACATMLYFVDLSTGERKTFVADHKPAFLEVGWPEPDLLTLTDEYYKNWLYRLSTCDLTEQ